MDRKTFVVDMDTFVSTDWSAGISSRSTVQTFCVDQSHNPGRAGPVLVSGCNHPDCIASTIHDE